MADSVGMSVVGPGDWGANPVRSLTPLPGGRPVALHGNDSQRPAPAGQEAS